jgi:trk/ktr system potassium uptake protein
MEVMRVVIAGAGTLGRRVAFYVRREGHDVIIVEKDPGRAQGVKEELGVEIVVGDADEPAVLEQAGLGHTDVVVAATGHDEDNLVVSLLAKNEFKVKKVIAVVRNPRNRWLYNRSWGVDAAIDSAQIVARLIEEEATITDVIKLLSLREGEITLTTVTATADGTMAGKTVQELHVPTACLPAAILRGTEVLRPTPDLRIQVGDELLVIAGPGGECRVGDIG